MKKVKSTEKPNVKSFFNDLTNINETYLRSKHNEQKKNELY
ncbi:MAG TPA: hypothetical protein VFC68_00945 [Treponemataceae bacterium]|nr:hypothetical protein [Treponemataceae bacterium]